MAAYDTLEAWLRLSATRLADEAQSLTALDQAIGDGDHGINMNRGFSAIVTRLDQAKADGVVTDATSLLRFAGKTLVSTVGGAAGPLYGTGFLRAGGALATDASSLAAGVEALDAAVQGIGVLGKSAPGKKTMLDALVPAVAAARQALADDGDAAAISTAARDAAEAGAEATIPMLATKGRASYLGERSIGHKDPGATSSALLLRALADAIGP
jgi:dihydroxyacetone kinase-like protein